MSLFNLRNLLPPRSDPRADQFPLMQAWTPTLLITLAYVVGVCAWRSELKKRGSSKAKKPQQNGTAIGQTTKAIWDPWKYVIILYNIIMVIYSAYVTGASAYYAYKLGYGFACVPSPDPSDSRTDSLVFIGYLFYISKFVEMLDTVFFLSRGKVDQVTFLHVFHHAAMPPSVWWGLKYAPGGMVFTFPLANSFIHVIMYTYYGLAAAGLYKYLWWKNYLTLAQMIQFVFLIAHQSQVFLSSKPCDFPRVFPAAIIFYASVFLVLFGNFYVKAYWRKQRLAKRTTSRSEPNGHPVDDVKSKSMTNGHVALGQASVAGARKRRD